jgi:hypothetical protein
VSTEFIERSTFQIRSLLVEMIGVSIYTNILGRFEGLAFIPQTLTNSKVVMDLVVHFISDGILSILKVRVCGIYVKLNGSKSENESKYM